MGKKLTADVTDRIRKLGVRIRLARKRRNYTIAETAEKAGINRNTVNALELGKPTVEIGAYVTVLWVLGLDRALDKVADPDQDIHGKTLELARGPKRIRKSRSAKDEYDF